MFLAFLQQSSCVAGGKWITGSWLIIVLVFGMVQKMQPTTATRGFYTKAEVFDDDDWSLNDKRQEGSITSSSLQFHILMSRKVVGGIIGGYPMLRTIMHFPIYLGVGNGDIIIKIHWALTE